MMRLTSVISTWRPSAEPTVTGSCGVGASATGWIASSVNVAVVGPVGNDAGSTAVPPPAARDSSSVVQAGAPVASSAVSAGAASTGAASWVASADGVAGGS